MNQCATWFLVDVVSRVQTSYKTPSTFTSGSFTFTAGDGIHHGMAFTCVVVVVVVSHSVTASASTTVTTNDPLRHTRTRARIICTPYYW